MPFLLEKPQKVAEDHYLLRIDIEEKKSMPGQFINIRLSDLTDPLLRRPFSIFDHNENILEIIIRVVGKTTEKLKTYNRGDIDLLGPLGRGFTLCENKNVLIAGGGVGNAPLYYLARQLKAMKNRVTFLYGTSTEKYIYLKDRFESASDDFVLATDDGSEGMEGTAPDIAGRLLNENSFQMVYTCGPTGMMKKIAEKAGEVPVEISVENYFGCGAGLCMGCTVETAPGQMRACVDGPVFNAGSIDWSSLEEKD